MEDDCFFLPGIPSPGSPNAPGFYNFKTSSISSKFAEGYLSSSYYSTVPSSRDRFQSFLQPRVPFCRFVVFDGALYGAAVSHEKAEFSSAGDACVEQIALKHHVLTRVHHKDDRFVFAALRLMDREGVGELKLIVLRVVVLHRRLSEAQDKKLFLRVDVRDRSDISIENVFVVVVYDLNDAISDSEAP